MQETRPLTSEIHHENLAVSWKATKEDDQIMKIDAERGCQGGSLKLMDNMVTITEKSTFSGQSLRGNLWKLLLVVSLVTYLIFISFRNHYYYYYPSSCSSTTSDLFSSVYNKLPSSSPKDQSPPTNLKHLVFGVVGSVGAWHYRKDYIESWWRPNMTRGFMYLDAAPPAPSWSPNCPPYRVSDNLTTFFPPPLAPVSIRIVHGIMELMRDIIINDVRWVVMGDDDTLFFVDNMVEVLSEYDHTKLYYIGGQSEDVSSNYFYSFNQGFGGAGFILSYPLATALANDLENCLRIYAPRFFSSDLIIMHCIADLGVNLIPHNGLHQIDVRGDLSGLLSSHPKFPLLSLHHFDAVDPIFPNMDRNQSTRHLMKAAAADQSRMLQQTICHHLKNDWSFSISWGYSVHIYERIMARSYLQKPIQTFKPWLRPQPKGSPQYMFNTRLLSNHSCEAPHVFFFQQIHQRTSIFTTYARVAPRGLPPCANRTADFVSHIRVVSPASKRKQMDRCECCDVMEINDTNVELKLRECMIGETMHA